MTEICKVKKIKNNFAYVELEQKPQCESCKACVFNKDNKLVIPAIMESKCDEGDTVVVRMPAKQYNFSAFILFGIPLVMFLIGLLTGRLIGGEVYMLIFGFALFIVGGVIASLIDRLFRKNKDYMPVVEDRIFKEIEKNI